MAATFVFGLACRDEPFNDYSKNWNSSISGIRVFCGRFQNIFIILSGIVVLKVWRSVLPLLLFLFLVLSAKNCA